MFHSQSSSSTFGESIKALEADIQHANTLAAALSKYSKEGHIQMRLSYSPFAPLLLFLIEWLDYNCTETLPTYLDLLQVFVYKVYVGGISQERKASLKEFYTVIYPSLRQLEDECLKLEDDNWKIHECECSDVVNKKKFEEMKICDENINRDDDCEICMESCSMVVLPSCAHSICISCFHDWNARSKSCPFCRGSLRRVRSRDLWVLTSYRDMIDASSLAKANLEGFYLYIESLPLTISEITSLYVCDYMI